uniref:Uncharacterized protein n=1 Tax=Solanum lycopersicum TaxID=4081 RepID=A0A3Q7FBM7_SOLLC
MDYVVIVGGLLLVRTLFQCIRWVAISKRGNKKFPPGPILLPLIGNLHNIFGDQPHKSLARLAQIYGLMMSLRMGQSVAKQVLQKQELAFSSRTIPDAIRTNNHHNLSVVFLPICSRWRKKNAFYPILEALILPNYTSLVSKFDFICWSLCCNPRVPKDARFYWLLPQTGESVNIGQAAFETMVNLLSNTIFSKDVVDP